MPDDYDHVFTALQIDEVHNTSYEVPQLETTKRMVKAHYKVAIQTPDETKGFMIC